MPALADGELHIYNWGDYTNPKLIEKFEKQYNMKVTIDDYDSNETMLNKVRGGNLRLRYRRAIRLHGQDHGR